MPFKIGTQTSVEQKKDMIKKIGTEFGSLFNSIDQKLVWITFK